MRMHSSALHRRTRRLRSGRRTVATAVAVAGAAAAVPLIATGTASAASQSTWDAVAQCESGGDWSIDTGNGFYGGLQFSESTWLGYGGGQYAQYANNASESQQVAIAEKVLASQGPGAWPTCGPRAGLSADGSSSDSSASSSSSSGSDSSSSSSDQSSSSSDSGSGSSSGDSTPASQPDQLTPTTSNAGTKYTVVSGDTLSQIAASHGVPNWRTLYNENESVVGSNPDLIFPGQVLTLG